MNTMNSLGYEVRSKNAGPFWLTVDIFGRDAKVYEQLCGNVHLQPGPIAGLLRTDQQKIKIFHVAPLNVIKVSVPRPVMQGAISDRDMHGAQWACLVYKALAE